MGVDLRGGYKGREYAWAQADLTIQLTTCRYISINPHIIYNDSII